MRGNFLLVGNNSAIDVVKILAEMGPQEARVFIMMKACFEFKTNITDLSEARRRETPTQKVQFSTGLTRLKDLDIVRHVGKRGENIYMISPYFIMPSNDNYIAVEEKWNSLADDVKNHVYNDKAKGSWLDKDKENSDDVSK